MNRKILIVLIALIVSVWILIKSLSGVMPNYSNGEWTGTVVKLSRKGMFFKSWEGQIVLGGMRAQETEHFNSKGEYSGSTTSSVNNAFEFNVDPDSVEKVKAAMTSGQPVTLIYREWGVGPINIENDHVVVGVK